MKKIIISAIVVSGLSSFLLCDFQKGNMNNRFLMSSMTKLDSLQGTWISSKDTNYKLVVIGNILMNLYENQNIDTSKFFLADTDSLPNVVMYDTTKVNGNYLILHSSGFAHIALSYKINYLSNESLELVYDNKYLPFDKQ